VAAILGVDKKKVWKLVNRGLLRPHYIKPHTSSRGVRYLFTRFDVERCKARLMDDKQLLSAPEAAKLLNENLSWFYKKWVKTGRLKTVGFEDKLGKHFFFRTDVEACAEVKKNTITGPEAAKKLGIYRTAVLKWTKSGKLRPVSGPAVDGFGCNLYLRIDIERLAESRSIAETESD
jgi:hypothetical protein